MQDEVAEPSFTGDTPVASEPEVLPDRRELALVAFERTRMPMVVSDPRQHDDPIVLANDAFLKLTGYTANEVLGRNCRFLQGPDTDPHAVDAIRRGLADGARSIEVELLNYRKDGTAFWNDLGISPIMDDDGELLYYFASQRDITARRRAQELEASERLLLMEVDHRAMNALALVQSFVSVSRSDTATGFASAVRGRVQALARAHRLLGEGAWTGVDLVKVIGTETPDVLRERVSLGTSPVALPALLVQPMSLVLHELMSNARQHGALQGPSDRVEIDWIQIDDRLRLSWREYVPREVTTPASEGVGLKLVKGVVQQQIGGAVDLEWRSSGLQIEFELPLNERQVARKANYRDDRARARTSHYMTVEVQKMVQMPEKAGSSITRSRRWQERLEVGPERLRTAEPQSHQHSPIDVALRSVRRPFGASLSITPGRSSESWDSRSHCAIPVWVEKRPIVSSPMPAEAHTGQWIHCRHDRPTKPSSARARPA